MNNQELRNLLINKIKEIGKIPKQIEIEGSINFLNVIKLQNELKD